MGVTSATNYEYKDPYGKTAAGYNIDGKIYKDAAGTQRIDAGSIVDTKNGQYMLGADGNSYRIDNANGGQTYINPDGTISSGTAQSQQTYDTSGNRVATGTIVPTLNGTYIKTDNGSMLYADYLKQQQSAAGGTTTLTTATNGQAYLDSAANAARQSVQLATDAAVQGYEGQRDTITGNYADTTKQLYAEYMRGQSGLANQLASQGLYNSGYSDTARVNELTNYQNNMYNATEQRNSQIKTLESEIAQAKLTGASNLASLESELAQLQLQQYNADRDYNLTVQQYNDSRSDVEYSRKASAAQAAADMGDFSQIASLYGIDTSAAELLFNNSIETSNIELQQAKQNLVQSELQFQYDYDIAYKELDLKLKQADNDQNTQLFNNALNAAEMGDFSLMKSLGLDTTNLENDWATKSYAAQLANKLTEAEIATEKSSAYKNYTTAANNTATTNAQIANMGPSSTSGSPSSTADDELNAERARQDAASAIQGWMGQGSSTAARNMLNFIQNNRDAIIAKYGEYGAEVYIQTALANCPGMSQYTEVDKTYAFSPKEYVSNIKNEYLAIDGQTISGLSDSVKTEICSNIINSDYSDSEVKEILDQLGLSRYYAKNQDAVDAYRKS